MPERKLVSFDWAMKKLLRSKANFEILEGFLSELLKDNIEILEILESESNKEDKSDKYNRVDLKVRNTLNEIIIIEVQYERELDYLQRILFGTAKVISEHQKETDPYSKIVKAISISIIYFDLGHGEDYIYRGTTSFKGIHKDDELFLSDNFKKIYDKSRIFEIFPEYYLIKVNQFDDIAKDTLDEWIYFLKNEEIKDNFQAKGLKKAKKELNIMKLPEKERKAYYNYMEDLRYQASMFESSYGVGKFEGIEEGIEKGIEKGIERMAINLIKSGDLCHEKISQLTELPLSKIKTLAEL